MHRRSFTAPRLVVLDEPTNGLDPNQIIEVRALIREIATDRAVIFSSHVLNGGAGAL